MSSLTLKEARGAFETNKHIHEVQSNIAIFIKELLDRSIKHDQSKLSSPEIEIFGEYTSELEKTQYYNEKGEMSDEYKALLEKVQPALDHHYSKNLHHPQHWDGGIKDMDLMDLVEMLADWISATKRNKNGNIHKSIEVNAERFKISSQLAQILENTVNRYF